MTDEDIARGKADIDGMSRLQMVRLYRNASSGHPYFVTGTLLQKHFNARFKKLGGMTSEISKQIGW